MLEPGVSLVHPHGGHSFTTPLPLPKRRGSCPIRYTKLLIRHIFPPILTPPSSYSTSWDGTPTAIFFSYYLSSWRHRAIFLFNFQQHPVFLRHYSGSLLPPRHLAFPTTSRLPQALQRLPTLPPTSPNSAPSCFSNHVTASSGTPS